MEQPEVEHKLSPMTLHSLAKSYRLLADMLESKTDCVIPSYDDRRYPNLREHTIHMDCYGEDARKQKFFPLIRALGTFKKEFDERNFYAVLEVEGLQLRLSTSREFVCSKVKVQKEVEVEEYDCNSLIDKILKDEIPGLEVPAPNKDEILADNGIPL